MTSALGLASQQSLGASGKQKSEARKGESGTPRVSLMEVYKDFLKQAIRDTEKLQVEAGVESFTHREMKYNASRTASGHLGDHHRHKTTS